MTYVPTREEAVLLEEFASKIQFGPYALADMQVGDRLDTERIPEGYYFCRSQCDNCGAGVFLYVAKGLEHPEECPELPCPSCGVAGHIYRPLGDKDYTRLMRKRMDEGGI